MWSSEGAFPLLMAAPCNDGVPLERTIPPQVWDVSVRGVTGQAARDIPADAQ